MARCGDFTWCPRVDIGVLDLVSELGDFRESLLWLVDICCKWCQLGMPFFLTFLFFGIGLLSFNCFFFFSVEGVCSSLVEFLNPLRFSVLQNKWRFPTVIEGSLLRIGVTLQTLISVS